MAKMTDIQKCRCFLWLINTLRSHRYTRAELTDLMMEQSFFQDQPELDRKTFRRFLDNVEELYGVEVLMDANKAYYIPNTKYRSDFQEYVDDALALMQLKGVDQSIEDNVILDPIPVAEPWLTPLGNAIIKQKKVHLTYKKFDHKEPEEYVLSPLALRQSKQRWYLLATKSEGEIRTFCFDRIVNAKILNEKSFVDKSFNAKEFYKYALGVYVTGYPIESVKIKASERLANYIRTNPLSPDQEETRNIDGSSTFSIKIRINVELENVIMTMLPDVEILEPASLREKIQSRMSFMN